MIVGTKDSPPDATVNAAGEREGVGAAKRFTCGLT